MIKIGLTGIFGSGKSTVSDIFRGSGVPVISCDLIVHRLLDKRVVKNRISAVFGKSFIGSVGEVDRKKLAGLVFSDVSARKRLDGIIHPLVFREMNRQLDTFPGKDKIVVVDIPLLFETGSEDIFDVIITVSTPPGKIRKRLADRFSGPEIEKRWKSQLPLEYKTEKSHYVVDNDKSPRHTAKQVAEILADIIRRRINDRRN